jgi:hypothetical protein
MKLKILIIITVFLFFACDSKPSKEESNIFDGTYQVTETGLVTRVGVWVFSKDEISILLTDNLENTFDNLGLLAVQKYYIKDNYIYTCLCTTDDCLNKEKNFGKLWKIESVSQTNTKRIIILSNVSDNSFKVKLEKDKSIGLDVKDWE